MAFQHPSFMPPEVSINQTTPRTPEQVIMDINHVNNMGNPDTRPLAQSSGYSTTHIAESTPDAEESLTKLQKLGQLARRIFDNPSPQELIDQSRHLS